MKLEKRAFPSLLGLERERHMEGVVRYLEGLGVQNVGRFVSRLPPVLGYDVKTNLVPKVRTFVQSKKNKQTKNGGHCVVYLVLFC